MPAEVMSFGHPWLQVPAERLWSSSEWSGADQDKIKALCNTQRANFYWRINPIYTPGQVLVILHTEPDLYQLYIPICNTEQAIDMQH